MPLGTLKGQRTRLVKKIEEAITVSQRLQSDDFTDKCTTTQREAMNTQIRMLRELQNRYEALSEKIDEAQCEIPESVKEGEESMDMILKMSDLINSLTSRVESLDIRLQLQPTPSTPSRQPIEDQLQKLIELETTRSQTRVPREASVNLPKLDFSPFYGEVLKWHEFWDAFSATVDNNGSLQPVQKLAYLLSKLRGEAKAVVSGFQTTNENYAIVVDMLRQRFGDEQTAITAHYSRIMEIDPVPNHVTKLRSLHDELEQHLRCLAALGEDTDHRHFISLIMTKLPKDVIARLEEMKGPDEAWSVQLLRTKLRNHLVARESADRQSVKTYANPTRMDNRTAVSSYTHHESRYSVGNRRNEGGRSGSNAYCATGETLYASDKEHSTIRKPTSVFCHGTHWSDECRRFATSQSRKKKLIDDKRCFNCLRDDHNVKNCRSIRPCFYCKKSNSHHSSLCLTRFSGEKESAHVAADDEEEPADESLLAGGERALLQTAIVTAISRRTKKRVQLRLLFDSGCHRSYISREAVQKLGQKPTGTETISVNTFGAKKSKSVQTQLVQFDLELQDKSKVTIVSNVVPTISASIRRQPLDLSKYGKALGGFKLADTIPKTQEDTTIDILIGSDYYMELLTFEKKALGGGLHLLGSKFGWILTGRISKGSSTMENHSMLILNTTNQSLPALRHFDAPDKCLPVEPSTEDFWSLEAIGIKDSKADENDEEAIRSFNGTVKYEEGR